MSVEPGGVPQKKIGQYWVYYFVNPEYPNASAIFYGFSYEEALAQYEQKFGVHKPAVMIERRPW